MGFTKILMVISLARHLLMKYSKNFALRWDSSIIFQSDRPESAVYFELGSRLGADCTVLNRTVNNNIRQKASQAPARQNFLL